MDIIKSDILGGLIDSRNYDKKVVILQGCNCFHRMGAGLAKYLKSVYPEVYSADLRQTKSGDRAKLGTYSTAIVDPNFHILNCYTQYYYGRDKGVVYADYDAIRSVLRRVNLSYNNWEIRTVKLGCELANGVWDIVKNIIEEELDCQDVTIYRK